MIEYNDNGMFTANLMNDTPIEIFIDNSATPSILPLRTYNKFPILHTYPMHDPGSHNCAVFVLHCINSSELHLQGVALMSQYSDPAPEAVTLQ